MSDADSSSLSPELGPVEIDSRSIQAFWHGYPSPLVRWHLHNEYELHLIIASSGRVFVGDHVGDFVPGQLIMTGPHLPHNWVSQTLPGDVVEMRDGVIQFRKHLVSSMAATAPELKKLLPLLERARHGIEFRQALCAEAEKWFEDIISSDGVRQIGLLLEILERLSHEREYRTLATASLASGTHPEQAEKMEHVISHICEHYNTNIRAEAVANLLGMSGSTFSHFFVKTTGSSFTQFLNSVRVARACELLSDTERPVTEICHAVGFNNVANFNRRFRELKEMTPSEYRKLAQFGHQ